MNIPWEEQPTPEHVWLELSYEDTESGWYKEYSEYYQSGPMGIGKGAKGILAVHRRPEPEFKQGDLVDVANGQKCMEIVHIDGDKAWVKDEISHTITHVDYLRKRETERDRFINIMKNHATFHADFGELYDAGFRYTGG